MRHINRFLYMIAGSWIGYCIAEAPPKWWMLPIIFGAMLIWAGLEAIVKDYYNGII